MSQSSKSANAPAGHATMETASAPSQQMKADVALAKSSPTSHGSSPLPTTLAAGEAVSPTSRLSTDTGHTLTRGDPAKVKVEQTPAAISSGGSGDPSRAALSASPGVQSPATANEPPPVSPTGTAISGNNNGQGYNEKPALAERKREKPLGGHPDFLDQVHNLDHDWLQYKLPPLVHAVRDGWQQKIQGGGIVSALLTAVATNLLTSVQTPDQFHGTLALDLTLVLCYISIFLNVSVVITGCILVNLLSGLVYKAAPQSGRGIANLNVDERADKVVSEAELLKYFGATRWWRPLSVLWNVSTYGGIYIVVTAFASNTISPPAVGFISIVVGVVVLLPPTLFLSVHVTHWFQKRRSGLGAKGRN